MRHIKALLLGTGLILATNAIVLAGVAYNRSGEPESTITLTERELGLPYYYSGNTENSGIQLRLTHRYGNSGYFSREYKRPESLNWFNKEKLAELGFDVSKSITGDEDKRHYQRLSEKEVFLVLEYNGAAYQSMLQAAQKHVDDLIADQANSQKINRAEQNLTREKTSASRLFVIDAGLDRDALRAKYADTTKYLLLKGLVKARITSERITNDGSSELRVVGYIKSLSNKTIHVPLQYHDVLEAVVEEGARRTQNEPPRFEATINIGQRLEPWLVGVEGL
jgi:hypothetical protein